MKNKMKNKQFIWIMICVFSLICNRVYAQTESVTLNLSNVKLSKLFSEIEGQTDYLFIYDKHVNASAQVSVNVVSKPLNSVLKQVLSPLSIQFSVKDKSIMLFKSKSKNSLTKPIEQISGVVVDAEGETLIGAAIVIQGTQIGTITGVDGDFVLQGTSTRGITSRDNIVVSYIGYKTQVLSLSSQTDFKVVMESDNLALSEVVVTALGIKREKKALSYNVQEVDSEVLLAHKDANFVNSLNGKVAGVVINTSSSGVGGASKVVMRGSKTISRSSNALYVIDGVPMFNFGSEGATQFGSEGATESISDINPEDIESVSILTGAAAAALYGSDASNGAIVITTKKGEAGVLKVSISSSIEVSTPLMLPEFQNTYGAGLPDSDVEVFDYSWGNKMSDLNKTDFSVKDDYLKTGVISNQSISLSTGTEKNQTYFSAGTISSKGIVPNNAYERYNFTMRNTTSFLNDKMTFDMGASYVKQYSRNMLNQGTYMNPIVGAYLFPRGADWEDVKMYERYNYTRGISEQYWPNQMFSGMLVQNPYWINYRNLRESNKNRYMMNVGLNYKITDWISLSGRVRIDNSSTESTKKIYASTLANFTQGSTKGRYGVKNTNNRQTYADFLANLNKSWGELNLHANIGASVSDLQQKSLEIDGGIREDGISNVFNVMQLDQGASQFTNQENQLHDQTQAVFASAELGYKGTYYLTLTGRNDWPSQLAGPFSNVKSFFYPSVGGSVILSNVIEMPKQIEYVKLRGSFASVGIPFQRFLANPTYGWSDDAGVWESASHYPIYNLKPEKTDSYEIGLTVNFLKNFNLDLGLYTTETFNQTFNPKISVSSGYSTLYVQTGSVQNKGIELALGYKNTWNKFSWSSNYTFSTNDNEILDLMTNYIHPETGEIITKDELVMEEVQGVEYTLKPGGTMGDVYINSDFERDSEGNILINEEGELTVNNNVDNIFLGSVFSAANMAWSNTLNYAGINFSFLVTARLGGVVFSRTQKDLDEYGVSQATADARDAGGVWINNGQDRVDSYVWYNSITSNSLMQYYTYDATNVRLQEVSLGYTIPKEKLANIADITLSLVGRNLLMLYCKAPFDPEAVASTGNYYQGFDSYMMPSLRNIGFNLRLNF